MFHREPTPLFDVVIGIRSDSVYGLIVMNAADTEKPLILYSIEEPIREYVGTNVDDMFHALKEALFSATLSLAQNGFRALKDHAPHAKVSHLFVVSGAPFGTTVTRTIRLSKDKPFKVTPDFIQHVVEESKIATDAAKRESIVTQALGVRVVNTAILDARLNGYTVHTFQGQEASELLLSEVVEVVPELIKKTLEETEKNLLPHVPMREHTYAFALSLVMREHYPHTPHMIAFDVHAHHTECVLIRDGVLLEHTMAEYGISHAVAEIGSKLKTLNAEAYGHLRGYGLTIQHEDVETALSEVADAHAEVVIAKLTELKSRCVLPKEVIVLTSTDYAKYASAVAERAFARVGGAETCTVRPMSEHDIRSLVQEGESAATSSIASAILARFVHIQHALHRVDTTKVEVY